MSDADCTPGREPRIVAASTYYTVIKTHRGVERLRDVVQDT